MIVTLWKCRLCGVIAQGEADRLYPKHELDDRINATTKSQRIGTHECRLGSIGVTDLVGATEVTS